MGGETDSDPEGGMDGVGEGVSEGCADFGEAVTEADTGDMEGDAKADTVEHLLTWPPQRAVSHPSGYHLRSKPWEVERERKE